MKIFNGEVVGVKALKTAAVRVERTYTHPVYGKRLKRSRKFQVDNELGAIVGQKVRFVACRPISKTKKWKIIEIVGTGAKALDQSRPFTPKVEETKKTVVRRRKSKKKEQ